MTQHRDFKYIKGLCANEQSIIKEIYQKYAPTVKAWVLRNSGTVNDAKDVFQEGLVAIFDRVCGIEGTCKADFSLTRPFGAFLFTICRNKWLEELRKKKRGAKVRDQGFEQYIIDSPLDNIIEIEERYEKNEKLARTFSKLSPLCQRLFQLEKTGHTPEEITKKLEMNSVQTYYRRKHACSSRWRELFNQ